HPVVVSTHEKPSQTGGVHIISDEPVCYPVRRAIYAGAWITRVVQPPHPQKCGEVHNTLGSPSSSSTSKFEQCPQAHQQKNRSQPQEKLRNPDQILH
ncbi:hypothetical protein, partial [Burkholderia ambifaria]